MRDEEKTREQLLQELTELRKQVAEWKVSETKYTDAGQKLWESEALLNSALEAAHMGIWDWHIPSDEVIWSDNTERLFGLAPGTFKRTYKTFLEYVHPEDQEFVIQAITSAIETRLHHNIEFRIVWPNGRIRWMAGRGEVFYDETDKAVRMIGTIMDITERKQAEEKLNHQRSYLTAFYETLLALMNRLDIDDLLKTIVTHAAALVGAPGGYLCLVDPIKGDLVNKTYVGVQAEPAIQRMKLGEGLAGKVWQTGQPLVIEDYRIWSGRLLNSDYDIFHAMIGIPLKSGGDVIGVIGLIHVDEGQKFEDEELVLLNQFAQLASIALDNARLFTSAQQELSERIRAEKELYRAKEAAEVANRAKSRFLANMSHEIRTPLNAILGYTQILQRDSSLNKSQRKTVDTIQKSGNHLLRLINDILDLSKIEAGRMQLNPMDFDLVGLLDDLSAMFQLRCQQNGLIWRVEGLEGARRIVVHGDEGKLRQVLINLLGNAVKFTQSGSVLLRVTHKEGIQYLFEVIDTGPGISLKVQKAIFNPFYQDEKGIRKGGTGLGLPISKTYVELMGGELAVDSDEGLGARFFFTIPLQPSSKAETLPAVSLQKDHGQKISHLASNYYIKALVVDDDRTNRDVLSSLLRDIGVEVLEATNGQEALEQVRKQAPDIVFMDNHMPVLDGVEATRSITQEFGREQIKIVMVSASAFKHEREAFINIGCHEVLTKPIQVEEILGCLANLLKVEYEYESVEAENISFPFSKIHLPADLLTQMKEEAEFCKITQFKQSLVKVENLGPQYSELVEYLKDLISKYDTDRILSLLERIRDDAEL
jgi:PAS domain S-box-containing protein